MTLTFNLKRATDMTHTHTNTLIHRSVGSKDRVETNKWTGGGCYRLIYLPAARPNGNYTVSVS